MDIRHCFVPYLPGILENDPILKNCIIKDGEDDRSVAESEGRIVMKAKEGGRGGENKTENRVEEEVKKKAEKEGKSEVEKEVQNGVVKGVDKGLEKEVEKSVVIMAKHLCGVATDLALRSLEAFIIPTSTSASASASNVDEHQTSKLPLKIFMKKISSFASNI